MINWTPLAINFISPLSFPILGTAALAGVAHANPTSPGQLYALWIIAGMLMILNGKIVFDWLKGRKNGDNSVLAAKKCIEEIKDMLEDLKSQHDRTENFYLTAAKDVCKLREVEVRKEAIFERLLKAQEETNDILQKTLELIRRNGNG